MPRKPNRKATRMTPGFNAPPSERKKSRQPRIVDEFGETGWGRPPTVQQGTLFDVRAVDQLPGNIEATRQRVGPRGYSRARLDEVRQGMGAAGVQLRVPRQTQNNWIKTEPDEHRAAVQSDTHIYGPSWKTQAADFAKPGMARLEQTLARSTVPAEDLKGMRNIHLDIHNNEWAGLYPGEGTIRLAGKNQGESYYGAMTAPVQHGQEQTLLHELGHHVSATAGTEHSEYATQQQRGQEEAYADKYALQHFRKDPRLNKEHGGEEYDPREHTYMARDQHEGGRLGYGNYHLSPVLQPRQHRQPEEAPQRDVGEQMMAQPMLDEQPHLYDTPVFTHQAAPLSFGNHVREEVPTIGGGTTTAWRKQYTPRPLKGSRRDEQTGELIEIKDPELRELTHRDRVYQQAATPANTEARDEDYRLNQREIEARWGTSRR